MSTLFFMASGILFGVSIIGIIARNDDERTSVSVLFVASGVFAIAGVLA